MRKKGRQLSADDKLRILEEARQPHTTVAEVLRRYQVDVTTFRDGDAKDRTIARLQAEVEKKSRIIAEVVEETPRPRKGALAVATTGRFSAAVKRELLVLEARAQERAARGWLVDRPPRAPAVDAILPEEKRAVITYALVHPKDGYRRLTWQMVDADAERAFNVPAERIPNGHGVG
jgi:transposase-like protein